MGDVIMEFKDKSEALFQLWKCFDEEDGTMGFSITSDFEGVSKLGGGCYWCAEFGSRSKAVEAMAKIIENAENNGDVVDKAWLIGKYGRATC